MTEIDEVSCSSISISTLISALQLKSLTKHLLNQNWRVEQNTTLLYKMLELEEPSISPKVTLDLPFDPALLSSVSQMVDFLLIDGTCEVLLGFITQIGNRRRPYPHESDSLELRYSYRSHHTSSTPLIPSPPRATMLLSVDEPADSLLSFLSRRASLISRAMFEVSSPPPSSPLPLIAGLLGLP
jgi:hypothetical protein